MSVANSQVIGFIGLGTMGIEMTRNLLKAGHTVQAFDVVPHALQAATEAGARVCSSVAEAAKDAFLIVTMLPDTPQVQEVVLGEGGLYANPPQGRIIIDMSTISPQAVRAMSATLKAGGIDLLDAPVSGGPQGAKSATLTIMVGGDAAAYERARPILAAMGTTINHVGSSGAGQTVKLCNQLMVGINLQAVCEAIALGRASGVDLAQMREVLLGGSAASWMLDRLGPAMIGGDASAGFRIDLMLKDLRLVGELAQSLSVPLPGNALVTTQYMEAKAHGEGGNGNQALFKVYDRMCNRSAA
ncbi:NAD(P)-dependent oxidoreductase [Acidisphaera sp. L21]|uniref:NAD(P)-dependent oxidoreductase n=1 Tax=Acidisphaera sp. L21 TaxID=1641851 RepID=UPI00131C43D7|nr:NAD(P)-dependent oxidoreductase [Acidisphaera sp. L21]